MRPPIAPPDPGSTPIRAERPTPSSDADFDPQHPILLMPAFHVQGDRLRPLKEWDMLTPEGRAELALKRHPGLRLNGRGFYDWGQEILGEERARQRVAEMRDLLDLLPTSSDSDARNVRKLRAGTVRPAASWTDTGGSWAERQRGGSYTQPR